MIKLHLLEVPSGYHRNLEIDVKSTTITLNRIVEAVQELQEKVFHEDQVVRDAVESSINPSVKEKRYSVKELRVIYQKHEYTDRILSSDNFLNWLENYER